MACTEHVKLQGMAEKPDGGDCVQSADIFHSFVGQIV